MTTLTITGSGTQNFFTGLSNIDAIQFNTSGPTNAVFYEGAFFRSEISWLVNIIGDGNANVVTVLVGSDDDDPFPIPNPFTGFSASAWTFTNWSAGDSIVFEGSGNNDWITGSSVADLIIGYGGNDQMDGGPGSDTASYAPSSLGVTVSLALTTYQDTIGAGLDILNNIENLTGSVTGADTLTGNHLNNVLSGLGGNDILTGGSGNDSLYGGADSDALYDTAGNDILDGGAGDDVMNGGDGNDTYFADSNGDILIDSSGIDIVMSSVTRTLGAGFEHLTLLGSAALNATGNAAANTLTGNSGKNILTGMTGNDALIGGGGHDVLTGGRGKDTQTGGGGRDFFDFNALAESVKGAKRDVITDFNRQVDDRIDLSTIDAKSGVGGNQAFKFIGTQAFHDVKGELRCKNGVVQGDVNGDGKADFEIKVNVATMVTGDFFL